MASAEEALEDQEFRAFAPEVIVEARLGQCCRSPWLEFRLEEPILFVDWKKPSRLIHHREAAS